MGGGGNFEKYTPEDLGKFFKLDIKIEVCSMLLIISQSEGGEGHFYILNLQNVIQGVLCILTNLKLLVLHYRFKTVNRFKQL